MKPEEITYYTELDREFASDLYQIGYDTNLETCDQFQGFLDRWEYWLDEESKKLIGKDWTWLSPLVADCRKAGIIPTKKHDPAMALTMPEKIFRVSIIKQKFCVPWGCAYIRMKEENDCQKTRKI